jgi:hypothetical protein
MTPRAPPAPLGRPFQVGGALREGRALGAREAPLTGPVGVENGVTRPKEKALSCRTEYDWSEFRRSVGGFDSRHPLHSAAGVRRNQLWAELAVTAFNLVQIGTLVAEPA